MADHRPLVVMSDEYLLDDVLRVAAAACCEVECAADVAAATRSWALAPLVLVDERAVRELAASSAPRAGALVLVSSGELADDGWRLVYETGVRQVVVLPDDESALVGLLADLVDGAGAAEGSVVAVVGGRGGAGSSVFAASLAVEGARAGGRCLLVDCDELSGGLDLVLGAEHDAGLRWPDLRVNGGRLSMGALREALPSVRYGAGELVLLSSARQGRGPTADGVAAVIEAGRRAGCLVVCDVPREPGDAGWAAVDQADLACVVVPAEVRASASARLVVARMADRARQVGLVVRGPAPDALSAEAISHAVGAEVVAVMRAEPKVAKDLERAEFQPRPGGPLSGAARAVLRRLTAGEREAAA